MAGLQSSKQSDYGYYHQYDGQHHRDSYFFHGFGVFEFNAHLVSPL